MTANNTENKDLHATKDTDSSENGAQAKGEPSIKKIGQEQQQVQKAFNLQRTYLKESSLEMPNAPHIFMANDNPQYDIQVNVGAEALAESVFHSLVRVTIHAKIGEHTLFLLETTQAGIYEIHGFEPMEIDQLLGIVCPSQLFNYLRVNIADIVTRTGLAQVNLADINFQALYEHNLQERAKQQQQQAN